MPIFLNHCPRSRLVVFALALGAGLNVGPSLATTADEVLAHYGDLAHVMYEDSAAAARRLQTATEAFLARPTPETLADARRFWRAARIPYMQTEALRFGNALVDEWEGRVNSWPLDEGLLDYVADTYGTASDENPLYAANIIASDEVRIGARTVDASVIDRDFLRDLHGAYGVDANVVTGYHAIEFLLWGQDLNGTGAGAGNRPASDYDANACTNGNCERRAAFLRVVTELLIADLDEMVAAWAPGGAARTDLAAKGAGGGLATILTGIGSLSYGELAGERMKLGLILHDPEEEHDCFSDNTHNSHYYDQVGMIAFWQGQYVRTDGSVVQGPSLRGYTMERDADAAARLDAAMANARLELLRIKETADSGRMAYDQMLAAGNDEGFSLVQDAIDALIAQTRATEAVVASLELQIAVEGSDSLDTPAIVQ
ncbi:MAG: peptidase [Proteobacteria bacterium]|nr:peptidase [Pseudomonadota bacterium]